MPREGGGPIGASPADAAGLQLSIGHLSGALSASERWSHDRPSQQLQQLQAEVANLHKARALRALSLMTSRVRHCPENALQARGSKQMMRSSTIIACITLTTAQAISIINHLAAEENVHNAIDNVRQVVLDLLGCEKVTLFLVFERRQELRCGACFLVRWRP